MQVERPLLNWARGLELSRRPKTPIFGFVCVWFFFLGRGGSNNYNGWQTLFTAFSVDLCIVARPPNPCTTSSSTTDGSRVHPLNPLPRQLPTTLRPPPTFFGVDHFAIVFSFSFYKAAFYLASTGYILLSSSDQLVAKLYLYNQRVQYIFLDKSLIVHLSFHLAVTSLLHLPYQSFSHTYLFLFHMFPFISHFPFLPVLVYPSLVLSAPS